MSKKNLWFIIILAVVIVAAGGTTALYVTAKIQRSLLQKNPEYSSKQYYSQALDQIENGDYTEAEKYLESALKKEDDSTYRNQLAVVKYHLKKYEESEKEYQILINNKKDLAFCYNGLGNVFRDWAEVEGIEDRDGKLTKAEEYYRQSIEVDKKYIAAYSNLAILLSNQKRQDESLMILDQGIKETESTELSKMKEFWAPQK